MNKVNVDKIETDPINVQSQTNVYINEVNY